MSPQIENGGKYGIRSGCGQLIAADDDEKRPLPFDNARGQCYGRAAIFTWRNEPSMLTVSPRTLKLLAAVVWHIGGLVLLLKARSLLLEADLINGTHVWPWVAVVTAVILGSLKARYIFVKSCRKNMVRIDGLERPYVWQFFRPGFFAALILMITAGAVLSRLAHGNYPFLIGVASLDMSIAIALLGSSFVFWQARTAVY